MIGLRKALKKALGRADQPLKPAPEPVGRASVPAPTPAAAPPVGPASVPAAKPAEDLPWYLQGEDRDAGWDATNPGTDPEKKNLTEK